MFCLGVTVNSVGDASSHIASRTRAMQCGIALCFARLSRIPSFGHAFLLFLWCTLVTPIGTYGMELFSWNEAAAAPLIKLQKSAWRRMLGLGGHSPIEAAVACTSLDDITTLWRTRRVAHFLHLMNSPPDSYEHVARLTFRELGTPWYNEALEDLRLCIPNVRILAGMGSMVRSCILQGDGRTKGNGCQLSPTGFPRRRARTPLRSGTVLGETFALRRHIVDVVLVLKTRLRRDHQAEVFQTLGLRAADPHSKTLVLFDRMCQPGPPLHLALDWVGPVNHRAAITSMLAGDWLLAQHA